METFGIKEARLLHKEYLKNYSANSIVLNLKNLPDIEYCHVHEDGKGWGRYVKNGRAYNIGRNNGETNCLIYDRYDGKKWRSASKIKQVFVLHDNPEVVRTYTKYIKEGHWWTDVNIYQMQKINPILFANVYDYMNTVKSNTFGFEEYEQVFSLEQIKPYLFPLSSMTEEQMFEFATVQVENCGGSYPALSECSAIIKWGYENHIDFLGLIEMGLAIDATGLDIY